MYDYAATGTFYATKLHGELTAAIPALLQIAFISNAQGTSPLASQVWIYGVPDSVPQKSIDDIVAAHSPAAPPADAELAVPSGAQTIVAALRTGTATNAQIQRAVLFLIRTEMQRQRPS